MAGYNPRNDKTVKKIGVIVLCEQPIQKMHLELKKYGKNGKIKLAIVFENEDLVKGEGKTYFTAKMPRLGWEEMATLTKKLPKMLETAYTLMDELS